MTTMTQQGAQDQEIMDFISMVPKHLRKYIQHGVFLIPSALLIPDYFQKKEEYLQEIANSKQPSVNSMHKYTSPSPLSPIDVQNLNMKLRSPLDKYYSLHLKHFQFKQKKPELFTSFSITYNSGHKGLDLHVDDSTYTVNLCLKNAAEGNQVIFNEVVTIDPIEDYALVHSGKVPHSTNDLKEGQRVNVVLWFK